MRKFLIAAFWMAFISVANAQSSPFAIVSSNGNTQLAASLDSAILKAGENDIIYAPGGSFSIGALAITKKVTIIGVGHYPDSSQATGRTSFDGSIAINPEASGSSFIGFYLTGDFNFNDDGRPIHSLLIEKCNMKGINHVHGGNNLNNISILHNTIRGYISLTTNPPSSNISIISNFIQGYINGVQNANFYNNIFLFPATSGSVLNNITNCNFYNNIFADASSNINNLSTNLTFTNNIFGSQPPDITNTGSNSGNKFNISRSALFVNDVGGAEFSYAANYKLKSNSPGSNAGIDGKDMGLYGGQLPYKDGAIPATPHIAFKEVAAQTGANGTLQVRFRVTTQ